MAVDFTSFLKKFSSLSSSIKTQKSAETGIKVKWSLIALLSLVILLLFLLMAAFIYLSEAAEPEALTAAELRSILYYVDGMTWKCSKSDRTSIEILFGIESAGYMRTDRVNSSTMTITLDEAWEFDAYISEEEGCFLVMGGRYEYPLYYSEDTAMVLIWEDYAITWELV